MVATNSVAIRTGNVSAGTSVFAMLVLEMEPVQEDIASFEQFMERYIAGLPIERAAIQSFK